MPLTPHQTLAWDHAARMFALARAMAEHGDDSPEADAIRDEMETTWYAMAEAGRAAVGELSRHLWAFERAISEEGPEPC